MMKMILSVACVCMLCAASIAHADTWYVKPDSTGEVINIQAGIDSCAVGDTVLVAQGVYQGNGNRDLIVNAKPIIIMSEMGPDATIIDCDGNYESNPAGDIHCAFDLHNIASGSIILNGFSITDCYMYGVKCDSTEAIIMNSNYYQNNDGVLGSCFPILKCSISDIAIINNRFTDNSGKAIESSSSNMAITNCLFSDHETFGVFCLEFMESRIIMSNSQVINNTNHNSGSDGAGILCSGSYLEMDSCTVNNNDGYDGLPIILSSSDSLIITNSEIANNSGDYGGIRIYSPYVYIQSANLSNNYSSSRTIELGTYSNVTIANSLIANNSGEIAAIYLMNDAHLSILNTTLYGNHRIYLDSNSFLDISGTIVAFNSRPYETWLTCSGGTAQLSCCDVYGNVGGDWVDCIVDQDTINGNMCLDPLFCDAGSHNYYLHSDSPCSPYFSEGCGLIGALPVDCSQTGIIENDIPIINNLYQNTPNPFNPMTTVRFDLTHAVHVKLNVYNVKGELIVTLVDQQLSEGRKEVAWSAKDKRGRAVSSGIYFYRLVAGDFVQTKKMVVLR